MALNDPTKLLESVKTKNKKYGGNKTLFYGNYYFRHPMVPQFLQIQIIIRPSQTSYDISRIVILLFSRDIFIALNIVR